MSAQLQKIVEPIVNAPLITIGIISAAQIKQARLQAQLQQRRTLEVLEEITEYDQEQFLHALSRALHFSAIEMKELNTLSPAFERVAFSTAQQKECLAFNTEENKVVLVFADPFNEGLQDWATEHVKQPFTWRLAHKSDIAAFLARHE